MARQAITGLIVTFVLWGCVTLRPPEAFDAGHTLEGRIVGLVPLIQAQPDDTHNFKPHKDQEFDFALLLDKRDELYLLPNVPRDGTLLT